MEIAGDVQPIDFSAKYARVIRSESVAACTAGGVAKTSFRRSMDRT